MTKNQETEWIEWDEGDSDNQYFTSFTKGFILIGSYGYKSSLNVDVESLNEIVMLSMNDECPLNQITHNGGIRSITPLRGWIPQWMIMMNTHIERTIEWSTSINDEGIKMKRPIKREWVKYVNEWNIEVPLRSMRVNEINTDNYHSQSIEQLLNERIYSEG